MQVILSLVAILIVSVLFVIIARQARPTEEEVEPDTATTNDCLQCEYLPVGEQHDSCLEQHNCN